MTREPLIDGHGRPIGDVRVSVTDRCNFRCQYCMPAEGLPWLNRDALLTYEEIERLIRLLSAMGVHDVRLTGGEPLVRKELWRLVEKLSAIDEVHDLSLTTNGYLLERQVGDLVRAGPAARQRVARLAGARPLLPAHPPRLAAAGARGPGRRPGAPRAAPDQGQRRGAARLHRGRGRPLRRVRAHRALRHPLHRVHAARRRPHLEPRPRAAQRGGARDDRRRVPARGGRPRAPRHLAPLALRRRQGRDRLHLPRHRAVLRRLQPHPADRRGRAAHVPVLDDGDRPARARCAAARPTPRSRPSSATPSGARSSSTTSTTRASCSRSGRCRASADDTRSSRRWRRSSTGSSRWRPSGRRWPTRRAAWPPRTPPRPSTCRRSTARRWTATRVRSADTAPGVAAAPRGRRGRRRGRVRRSSRPAPPPPSPPAPALPPGADAILQSELAEVADGHVTPERALEPGTHVRVRGEDLRAGDVLVRAGERLTRPAPVRAGLRRGRRGRRAPPPAAAPRRHRLGAAAARRAARAGPHPRVQRPDGRPAGRAARAPT